MSDKNPQNPLVMFRTPWQNTTRFKKDLVLIRRSPEKPWSSPEKSDELMHFHCFMSFPISRYLCISVVPINSTTSELVSGAKWVRKCCWSTSFVNLNMKTKRGEWEERKSLQSNSLLFSSVEYRDARHVKYVWVSGGRAPTASKVFNGKTSGGRRGLFDRRRGICGIFTPFSSPTVGSHFWVPLHSALLSTWRETGGNWE